MECQQGFHHCSVEQRKKGPVWLFVGISWGHQKLPSYVGIIFISHEIRIPKVRGFFFGGSVEDDSLSHYLRRVLFTSQVVSRISEPTSLSGSSRPLFGGF